MHWRPQSESLFRSPIFPKGLSANAPVLHIAELVRRIGQFIRRFFVSGVIQFRLLTCRY